MDFSTRGSQQSPAAPRPGTAFGGDSAPVARKAEDKGPKRTQKNKWVKWGSMALIVAVGVLLLALLGTLITSKNNSESDLVDGSKLQAVFLTNDQVYFGNITSLNSKYIALNNIYYLQTQGTDATNTTAAANSNVSLVKLGCELHKPYDRMVINRSEVQFWENLQADGQVANAVKQFKQQNPNGQKCSTATGASSTNVQGATQPATTTPAANTNKTSN
jgi:hypothetical protein